MDIIIPQILFYIFLASILLSIVYALIQTFNRNYKTRSKYFLERFLEIYMSETFGRLDRFVQHRLPAMAEKWGETIVRAIAKLIAIIVTIFLIIYEFPELKENGNFMSLLIVWGLYALLVFYFDYRKEKNQPKNENINTLISSVNELVAEIKQDREERKQKENYDG